MTLWKTGQIPSWRKIREKSHNLVQLVIVKVLLISYLPSVSAFHFLSSTVSTYFCILPCLRFLRNINRQWTLLFLLGVITLNLSLIPGNQAWTVIHVKNIYHIVNTVIILGNLRIGILKKEFQKKIFCEFLLSK